MKPHIIVHALAGTGKTFTLVEGIKHLRGQLDPDIVPSLQQSKIWDKFGIESNSSAMCFAAFSVAIKDELVKRIPKALNCDVMTMHSMGYRAIRNEAGMTGIGVKFDKKKVDKLISEAYGGKSMYSLHKSKPGYVPALKKLVQLSKYMGHTSPSDDELSVIAAYYDVAVTSYRSRLFDDTREIMKACLENFTSVDFDDMPWLPVVMNLPMKEYDTLLLDEAQDLNKCQQQLALASGKRIIAVGDKHQAIYGFAGADVKSMDTIAMEITRHKSEYGITGPTAEDANTYSYGRIDMLPLTISYRCSQTVAAAASLIVPDFEAHPNNIVGSVSTGTLDSPKPGDMVLCRVNAPLIRTAFSLITRGFPSKIIGQNIKASMLRLIKLLKPDSVSNLAKRAEQHKNEEVQYLEKRRAPSSAILACRDKYNCLIAICRKATSLLQVNGIIEILFSSEDQEKCVRLSSIHRAKGLEANNVYVIRPDLIPHPLADSEWQMEQEMNLKYVAITRAKENLIWVEE